MKRFLFSFYNVIRPLYLRLETYVRDEIKRVAQAEQFRLAEQKLKDFRARMTPKKRAELTARPDPSDCNHLKGGKYRIFKDYSVFLHTLPDGQQMIRCMKCGQKWFKTDLDWKEALNMVSDSSNRPSSSEILLKEYKWI